MSEKVKISHEDLAYWYFRLNGFLTIQNFIVHPDRGYNQKTDVDVLGIRFPHRLENLALPMRDAEWVYSHEKPHIVLTEVKTGRCAINSTWLRDNGVINHIIRAVGAFPEGEVNVISEGLREKGIVTTENYQVSLVAVGKTKIKDLNVGIQISWKEIVEFIHKRFNDYIKQKANHVQWDDIGKEIWNLCIDKSLAMFEQDLREEHSISV